MSVLRNTRFALGHEMGGADWEGIKREGVGHDRETTIMGAALTVRNALDNASRPSAVWPPTQGRSVAVEYHNLSRHRRNQHTAAVSKRPSPRENPTYTLMPLPCWHLQAVSKLDTDVLPRVAAIETKGEEYRKQVWWPPSASFTTPSPPLLCQALTIPNPLP